MLTGLNMQRVTRHIIFVLFNLILYICESNFVASSNIPISLYLWSWECVNNRCIPVKKSQTLEKMQSLETCNVLCSFVQIWPLPTGMVKVSKSAVAVHPQLFHVEIITAPSTIVRQHLIDAFQLFKNDLRVRERVQGLGNEYSVIVRISVGPNGDPRMRLNTDESYELELGPATPLMSTLIATIQAPSFCGARHALETLSQLVWLDHYVDSLFMLLYAKIVDQPKFPYRGLMIDTARNFIPMSELMRTVDAMAASKLNTLHWHATDSQAFSLQLTSAPHLAQYGSYGPNDVYTVEQIKALVRHARLRGIRILIEIDTPAHVNNAWSKNLTANDFALMQCNTDACVSYCEDPPCGQFNPLNSMVFEVLHNIYSEILDLTEVDDIFHLGGDDVSEACWNESFNGTDPMSLWLEYTRSIIHRIECIKGKMPNITIFWSSRLCQYIKTDLKDLSDIIAFQIRNQTWATGLSGIHTIVSDEDEWDLNSGYRAWYDSKSKKSYNSWQRFYEHRPWKNSYQNIGGGEATLWSWTVDEGGLHERVWPRAAALAERLWSDRAEVATRTVHERLDVHRARMAARGLHCAPIWSRWCTQHPFTCS